MSRIRWEVDNDCAILRTSERELSVRGTTRGVSRDGASGAIGIPVERYPYAGGAPSRQGWVVAKRLAAALNAAESHWATHKGRAES